MYSFALRACLASSLCNMAHSNRARAGVLNASPALALVRRSSVCFKLSSLAVPRAS